MGNNLFRKVNNGETTTHDGNILKLVFWAIFIAGILVGIAIGIN